MMYNIMSFTSAIDWLKGGEGALWPKHYDIVCYGSVCVVHARGCWARVMHTIYTAFDKFTPDVAIPMSMVANKSVLV